MDIVEQTPLIAYTTLRIGGPARFFCVVKTVDDIKTALQFANARVLRWLLLGGGSNVLISDLGFNGLVIKNELITVFTETIDQEIEKQALGVVGVISKEKSEEIFKSILETLKIN